MIKFFLRGEEVSANRMPTDLLRTMRAIMLDEALISVSIVDRDGVEYKVVGE